MTTPIDFSNMLQKPFKHAYVPADRLSITFVFQDGMRRSFGAAVDSKRVTIESFVIENHEGAFVELRWSNGKLESSVGLGETPPFVSVQFPAAATLIELPE